jgi:hypothetical protein
VIHELDDYCVLMLLSIKVLEPIRPKEWPEGLRQTFLIRVGWWLHGHDSFRDRYPVKYTDSGRFRNPEAGPLPRIVVLASNRLRRDNSSDGEGISRVPDGRGKLRPPRQSSNAPVRKAKTEIPA